MMEARPPSAARAMVPKKTVAATRICRGSRREKADCTTLCLPGRRRAPGSWVTTGAPAGGRGHWRAAAAAARPRACKSTPEMVRGRTNGIQRLVPHSAHSPCVPQFSKSPMRPVIFQRAGPANWSSRCSAATGIPFTLRAAVDHEICFTLLVIWKYRRRGVACNIRISWIHFDRFEASRYRQQRRHRDGQQ